MKVRYFWLIIAPALMIGMAFWYPLSASAGDRQDNLASYSPESTMLSSGIEATAVVTGLKKLESSYELAQGQMIEQTIFYQIPMGYDDADDDSVPLIIGLHGYGGFGHQMRDFLAPEANERGWLLAAPNMHNKVDTNDGKKAFAWIGAQHDVIDTIDYMIGNYPKVDESRIYIVGPSMGGQATAVMAAKYPDVFAAAAPWKGISDLTVWYDELDGVDQGIRNALYTEVGGNGTPADAPFEYQRRSAWEMAQNIRLVPLKMWHDQDDVLVVITQSIKLKQAIDSWNPPIPPTLVSVSTGLGHAYDPDLDELFDFLENYTLSSQPPPSLTIRTDESKPYYWLNILQTGEDHWTEVEAIHNLTNNTVTALISDTQPLTVAFNLGSTSIEGPAGIPQSGLGLPATTYQVTEEGNNIYTYQVDYTSGYFTVPLINTGLVTVTIAPFSPSDDDSNRIYLPVIERN